jgi:hypothetical protein
MRIWNSLLAWLVGSFVTAVASWVFFNVQAVITGLKGQGRSYFAAWTVDATLSQEFLAWAVIFVLSLVYGLIGWLTVLLPISLRIRAERVCGFPYLIVSILGMVAGLLVGAVIRVVRPPHLDWAVGKLFEPWVFFFCTALLGTVSFVLISVSSRLASRAILL